MTTRRILLLAIAGVLLIYVLFFLPKPDRTPVQAAKPIPVLVANRDIPPYTLLSSDDVTTRLVPPAEAADSFDDPTDLEGLMTTQEVRYGNVLRRSSALKRDETWVEGETLIFSFYVSTSRIVGGQLRPGHHVDLLVTRPEQRDRPSEALWLANNLWVVGVYQASGDDVDRPNASFGEDKEETTGQQTGGAFAFNQSAATMNTREGPANLVVIAAHRDTGRLIADYLGAQLYEPWIYVQPGPMSLIEPPIPARIDGLVFHDLNADQERQTQEEGLAQVDVTLYGEDGNPMATVQTAPDGTFFFDQLETGGYKVVETDPQGYESVSENELSLRLVGGQNQHVRFSDMAIQPTSTPVPTLAPTQRPAEPTRSPAPTEAPPSPTPEPGECTYRVYMSLTENGPEITPATVNCKRELWAVVEFSNCDASQYSVLLTSPGSDTPQQIGTGAWTAGSGKRSIRITAPDGRYFHGNYTTFLSVGGTTDMRTSNWYADGDKCTGAEGPVTGFGFDRPSASPRSWVVPEAVLENVPTDVEIEAEETVEAEPRPVFGFDRGR